MAPREQPAVGAPVLDSRAIEIQKVLWEALMEVRIWTLLQAAQVMSGLRCSAKLSRIPLSCLISSLASCSGSSGTPESLLH